MAALATSWCRPTQANAAPNMTNMPVMVTMITPLSTEAYRLWVASVIRNARHPAVPSTRKKIPATLEPFCTLRMGSADSLGSHCTVFLASSRDPMPWSLGQRR